MVYKCCVPNCRGNYKNSDKVHVFRFPKDEELKRKWLNAIPRENFVPTKNSRVCHVHFTAADITWDSSYFDERSGNIITVRLNKPNIRDSAVPSLFPNCPSYLSAPGCSRPSPEEKRMRLEARAISQSIADSIASKTDYDSQHSFSNVQELVQCCKNNITTEFWDVIVKNNCVMYLNFKMEPELILIWSVVVTENLNLTVHHKNISINKLGDKYTFPCSVSNVNEINQILSFIENLEPTKSEFEVSNLCIIINDLMQTLSELVGDEKKALTRFISSQISFIQTYKNHFRYDASMLIFASIIFFISPHSYKFIRHSGNIILPHPSTIRRICSDKNVSPQLEQLENNFLSYIASKFPSLKPLEHYVVLMLDEIHIKPYLDYKGGNIAGMAFNNDTPASSAHVFMIQSVFSKFKDVVHIMPVSTLTADILNSMLKKVIIGLENIGIRVVCVVSDNNSLNRKAVSLLANPAKLSIVYPNPADKSRPLFFAIDSVHIIKSIRNNWINQRNDGHCFFFPNVSGSSDIHGINTASFSTLRKLHHLEYDKLLKYGYGLTLKALWPSSMEKQNVKLVLQIFNSNIVASLRELGPQHNLPYYEGTASFIETITTWWNIVNVKTPFKGQRLRDSLQEPLTNSPKDSRANFLKTFLDWLDEWENMLLSSGTLTRETHSALQHTTHSLLEISDYCANELKMSYLLPGKIQTDSLEARFGQYRQLAGSQYHVSIRQIFEIEKKIRMPSILELSLSDDKTKNVFIGSFNSETDWDYNSETNETASNEFLPNITVNDDDIAQIGDDLPVVTYLAGYCAYTTLKRLQCDSCKNYLVSNREIEHSSECRLISSLDRGGLLFPQQVAINAVCHNYIVVKKLVTAFETDFLKAVNQRVLASTLTTKLLVDKELTGEWDMCANNHTSEKIIKMLVWASTNTLLKNYCKLKNDSLHSTAKGGKKRKLETLNKC